MKVVVIGGGTSGLLSSLALEKEGHDVVVLEKNNIGGLCRSEKVNGYTVDIGVHAITMLNNGPLIRLLNKYARFIPNFKEYGDYYVRENNELYKIPVSMQEWLTTPLIPHKDKVLITTKIMDLMTTGFTKDTSVYDVVSEMGLSDVSIKFFDTICYFLSGENMENTPLWRLFTGAGYIPEDDILPFIYKDLKINPMKSILVKKFSPEKVRSVLSDGFLTTIKNSSKKYLNKFVNGSRYWTQGYPVGGVQSIRDCILYSLNNTKIKNEEVVSIEEEKNGYVVSTKEDNYYADVVVFSAPSRYLPDIAKVDEVQKLKDKLRNIKFTKSLTVWIGHEENPFPYLGSEVWIDPPCWATCVTNYDKSLAPKGMHLMGFSFVGMKKKNALSAIENKLGIDINKADMVHVQESIPEQASCCIGQFFVYPKIKDNFYVIGTDADPRSMGITRAAYSVEVMLSEFKCAFKKK